jgi:uncharacterized SAM-binding protein YcdF (DUF218 family)
MPFPPGICARCSIASMVDATFLKGLFKALLLPPTGPLLIATAGLLLLVRRWRAGRILAWSGVLLLFALSTPAVAYMLLSVLDRWPAFDARDTRGAQAIVILGGGVRRHATEYGGDTLGRLTLERVRYGAYLARATKLPVLVTGGAVFGGEPEAKLMRTALESEFGIPVRWAEAESRNTHENAVRSAHILSAAHVERVILVSHSFDMLRAKAEFAAQRIDAIPAPTGMPDNTIDTPLDLLPSLGALQGSYFALYEILANFARWIFATLGGTDAHEQHASYALPVFPGVAAEITYLCRLARA